MSILIIIIIIIIIIVINDNHLHTGTSSTWKSLRWHRPRHQVGITKNEACQLILKGKLTEAFQIQTGITDGRL